MVQNNQWSGTALESNFIRFYRRKQTFDTCMFRVQYRLLVKCSFSIKNVLVAINGHHGVQNKELLCQILQVFHNVNFVNIDCDCW